jgi:uncharacterized protein YndB with AHSA1/START domain
MNISENAVIIERVFETPRKFLWEAWTNPEFVKKWWGPKEFYSPSIQIDFKEGGKYIYCMRGPKGSVWDKDLYSAGVFKEIVPEERIVITDYFSDAEGNKSSPTDHGLVSDMPAELQIAINFVSLSPTKTKLILEYAKPESAAALEAMKKSGMEEGWGTSLDKLENLLLNNFTSNA